MTQVVYGQKGYLGSSMSVRAAEAYEQGEMPISRWTNVDSWDVEERSILNLQFALGTPPLSEIIKDFQDFKDNELSRLAFITKNVADAWERKSMGNEDLPLLRESHNLSAKCARITDISLDTPRS